MKLHELTSTVVCGNWAANHPIPPGAVQIPALNELQATVHEAIRNIVEKPYPEEGWITVNLTKEERAIDKENFAKMQGVYEVCMNFTAHEEEGLDHVRDVAKTVVQKFPATPMYGHGANMTYNHAKSFGETLVFFESLGIETTQRILQTQYLYGPNKIILKFDYPKGFGGPSDVDALRQASKLLAAVHPANLTWAKSLTLMASVIDFQTEITFNKISDTPLGEEPGDFDLVSISLTELQKLAPQLNYEYVVNQLAPAGTDTSIIATKTLKYWQRISQIISKTPPEVLQAFFVWRSIAALSSYVESPQMDAWRKFQVKQEGIDTGNVEPRWQKCVKLLDSGAAWTEGPEEIGPSGLTHILTRFFADKGFTPEAKAFTAEIIKNLEEAFIERVKTREWATDQVKQTAIDVLNALILARSRISKKWASLNKPFAKGQFVLSTLLTNAGHSATENAMLIHAAIQQAPLYNPGYPAYLAYGGMGSVVGHEITHGFDGNGHLFDKTGNFSSWFDEQSSEGFAKATQCFVKQYSNFTVTDPNGEENKVDGQVTANENIADAGGVLASYAAWKRYEEQSGKALDLPGLAKWTHEQLFFIKYGQNWCENLGSKGSNDLKDVHAPSRARILLPLENSVDFQKAFNCPKKEPTCELW